MHPSLLTTHDCRHGKFWRRLSSIERIDESRRGLPVGFLPGGFEDPDVGEVAVTLGEIESVADDEFVGNFETDKIGLEGDLTAAFLSSNTHTRRLAGLMPRTMPAMSERVFPVSRISSTIRTWRSVTSRVRPWTSFGALWDSVALP